MNPENRFRLIGVLALAGLVSYAIYAAPEAPADAPAATFEQVIGDNS